MLAGATACYSEILDLYGRIRTDVAKGSSAAAINRRLEKIKTLFFQAEQHEAAFEAETENTGGAGSAPPCLIDWQNTVSTVLEENASLQKYLQSAMAVTKHEMHSLGAAKKALGGYRGPGAHPQTGTRIDIRSG